MPSANRSSIFSSSLSFSKTVNPRRLKNQRLVIDDSRGGDDEFLILQSRIFLHVVRNVRKLLHQQPTIPLYVRGQELVLSPPRQNSSRPCSRRPALWRVPRRSLSNLSPPAKI